MKMSLLRSFIFPSHAIMLSAMGIDKLAYLFGILIDIIPLYLDTAQTKPMFDILWDNSLRESYILKIYTNHIFYKVYRSTLNWNLFLCTKSYRIYFQILTCLIQALSMQYILLLYATKIVRSKRKFNVVLPF